MVAQAGRSKMITIATNMAGRGTDIVLGGSREVEGDADKWEKAHEAVIAAGGLHIIGTERHESRRIDNQLRGRSGRQGDPGSSRFYLSLEDPLLKIFASDRVASIMDRLKLPEGEAIEHPWVTRAIENAQRKVEGETSIFANSCWNLTMWRMINGKLFTNTVINYLKVMTAVISSME